MRPRSASASRASGATASRRGWRAAASSAWTRRASRAGSRSCTASRTPRTPSRRAPSGASPDARSSADDLRGASHCGRAGRRGSGASRPRELHLPRLRPDEGTVVRGCSRARRGARCGSSSGRGRRPCTCRSSSSSRPCRLRSSARSCSPGRRSAELRLRRHRVTAASARRRRRDVPDRERPLIVPGAGRSVPYLPSGSVTVHVACRCRRSRSRGRRPGPRGGSCAPRHVVDLDVVRAGVELRDASARRRSREIVKPARRARGASSPGPARLATAAPSEAATTSETARTRVGSSRLLRAAAGSDCSGAQLGAEALGERGDDALARPVASSSVSVRSGDWNARWIATDLRPAPTWSPR